MSHAESCRIGIGRGLGSTIVNAIIHGMSLHSDNPDHGFQFPGVFEITVMGPADAGLEERIPHLLETAGIEVLRETVAGRSSSGGRFVSIRLSFRASSREVYEHAHALLRADPNVRWTL